MSAEVTDADRAMAEQIAVDLPGLDFDDNGQSWAEHVSFLAQALADQRAAADDGLRARVEALADEYDANINWREWGVGNRIRRAAQGPVTPDPPTAAPCPARHDVTGDSGVPAQWSCQVLGEHDEHQDSTGRGWKE